MAKKKKILAGLSNIHFAPFVDGAYETPVPILFAKKIENKLDYENDAEWADDKVVDNGYDFVGGEGTLSVLALTAEEQALLFGNAIVKGGIVVNSNDVSPEGAFLFERKKKRSTHKRLYVVYNCVCSPTSISAETIEDGKGEGSVDEISYSIGENENGDIYHYIDTDDTTASTEAISKWFTEVQLPQQIEAATMQSKVLNDKK
jgi:phi13 family phage major tail protein